MTPDVKFGTSGVRGPADALLAGDAAAYVAAFLRHLQMTGTVPAVCLGRDLRASSPALAAVVARTVIDMGVDVQDAGPVATPALAHFALARGLPSIMVTGSHIPADRNGLKFFTATGEITKDDEAAVVAMLGETRSAVAGMGRHTQIARDVTTRYRARYADVLAPGALSGRTIGVFGHSTVLRDDLVHVLDHFGARTIFLGQSAAFVPVDTEALGDPIFAPLPGWIRSHGLDAVVSADADGDRPLMMDDAGCFVRGDALGALAARALGAVAVVIPVTANSGLEAALTPARIVRTRVGSPFVLAAMAHATGEGPGCVVGFEANGGLMLGTPSPRYDLEPLPTRDAILPLLLALGAAGSGDRTVSATVADLALRAVRADRVGAVPDSAARALMTSLSDSDWAAWTLSASGAIAACDPTDGLRFTFADGAVLHVRRSGNAPEMRCYSEADNQDRAGALLEAGLALIVAARDNR